MELDLTIQVTLAIQVTQRYNSHKVMFDVAFVASDALVGMIGENA